MNRPLASVAIIYATGIVLADRLPVSLGLLLFGGLALGAFALFWRRARTWLLPAFVLFAAAANFTFRTAVLSPNDLRRLVTNAPALVEVRARLLETPSLRVYQDGDEQKSRVVAELEVLGVRPDGGTWHPAHGRVASSTAGELPTHLTKGSIVRLVGVLDSPPLPLAAGLFDYRAHLQRRGIYYQLKASNSGDWTVESAAPLPLSERFVTWAKATLGHGLPHEDEPLRLLWAMALGWRTGLGGDVSEPFMRSGTMHVFAISGLHIALIATILVVLLRVCRVPRCYCGWIVIPLIWFYTGATGWQASAIRSTLMSSVVIAGWTMHRPSNLLNSLSAAALIILLWDPQQLFQAGFLLSFAVVLSMALFEPVLREFPDKWAEPDPFLPERLHSRWVRWRQWVWRKSAPAVIGSAAAWVGSIPLVAYYFHLFTPVTLLANLIIVPLSSLALVSSLASLVVGPLFPGLAAIFNHSSWFIMLSMVELSEWFARWPGAYFHVAAPGALLLSLYFGLMLALLCGWLKRRPARLVVVGVAFALAAAWLTQRFAAGQGTELAVLPLGKSHAVYLDVGVDGEDWLIDCGSDTAARFATRPFLAARGVNWIDHLALTHGDIQHVEGLGLLQSTFAIATGWVGPTSFRSPAYRDAAALLESRHQRRRVQRGESLGPWTVLHPAADDRFAQADDAALVVRGDFSGMRVLLLSDLGRRGQQKLLSRTSDLRSDVVVVGFPLEGEPLVGPLLEAISPRLVVIAEAPEPMSELRLRKLRERIEGAGVTVMDTRETGAVTIVVRKGQCAISTAQGESASQPIAWPLWQKVAR